MGEEMWAPVPSAPGYEVSDLGRVRGPRGMRPLHRMAKGYMGVYLHGADRSRRYVHQVVLEAFVGPCPPGMECLHENDVKTDNRLSNLRWDTRRENMRESMRNGKHRFTPHRGEDNGEHRLTEKQVREIIALLPSTPLKDLGSKYGVTSAAIHWIDKGRNWGWLKARVEEEARGGAT